MTKPTSPTIHPPRRGFNEDWLAVLLAFLVILLSTIGIFGPQGWPISF
jgi:hypothetical protein